jgi:hypothetical protein
MLLKWIAGANRWLDGENGLGQGEQITYRRRFFDWVPFIYTASIHHLWAANRASEFLVLWQRSMMPRRGRKWGRREGEVLGKVCVCVCLSLPMGLFSLEARGAKRMFVIWSSQALGNAHAKCQMDRGVALVRRLENKIQETRRLLIDIGAPQLGSRSSNALGPGRS